LGKLRAFGYGPTASIKSGQMRKASFKFGWNGRQLHKLETFGWSPSICNSFIQLWATSNSLIQSWAI